MKPVLCATLALFALGCGKDTTDSSTDSGGESAYDAMTALFDASCGAGCHTGGASSGGLALDAATAAANLVDMPAAGSSEWTRVVCGDVENSSLYQKLFDPAPYGDPMPLGVPLTEDEMMVIETWINSDECGAS